MESARVMKHPGTSNGESQYHKKRRRDVTGARRELDQWDRSCPIGAVAPEQKQPSPEPQQAAHLGKEDEIKAQVLLSSQLFISCKGFPLTKPSRNPEARAPQVVRICQCASQFTTQDRKSWRTGQDGRAGKWGLISSLVSCTNLPYKTLVHRTIHTITAPKKLYHFVGDSFYIYSGAVMFPLKNILS